jgi:hypothetical protein
MERAAAQSAGLIRAPARRSQSTTTRQAKLGMDAAHPVDHEDDLGGLGVEAWGEPAVRFRTTSCCRR